MANRGAPKEATSFAGLTATETKLLVLANVCLKNDKVCGLMLNFEVYNDFVNTGNDQD